MTEPPTCCACLFLGDDHGDNTCTFRCGRHEGHLGNHVETFERNGGSPVRVEWQRDEREPCTVCGKLCGTDRGYCSMECYPAYQEQRGRDLAMWAFRWKSREWYAD